MDYVRMSEQTLRERMTELQEHVNEPYLTEQRREAIRTELGRIGFELHMREQEKVPTNVRD